MTEFGYVRSASATRPWSYHRRRTDAARRGKKKAWNVSPNTVKAIAEAEELLRGRGWVPASELGKVAKRNGIRKCHLITNMCCDRPLTESEDKQYVALLQRDVVLEENR